MAERKSLTDSRVFHLAASDVRFKQFKRKSGTLYILAVDTSGSMAFNRIGQAKGALTHLLRRSYINRDRIALVVFRGRGAEVLLPPSQSHARARRILEALPVGGSTPLAAALVRVLELAARTSRHGSERVKLLVFTDGRANVSLRGDESEDGRERRRVIKSEIEQLGAALMRANVSSVVVDTQNRFTSGGEAESLAASLGGRHLRLNAPDAVSFPR